jgi:hypothetical protein
MNMAVAAVRHPDAVRATAARLAAGDCVGGQHSGE